MDLRKLSITGQEELENGFEKLTLNDGTVMIGMFTILPASAPVVPAKPEGKAPAKPAAKAKTEEVDVPEDWEELDEMEEDDLITLIDQEELDTDADDFEDDLPGLKKAIAKELEIELPKAKGKKEEKAPAKPAAKEEPEDDDLEWADLLEMDEDQLKDLIDEEELDTDPDDFEDDLVGLRKAIAKELEIEIPKKKK